MTSDPYTSGDYLFNNPTWHVEDAAWKAQQILRLLNEHSLSVTTVCDIGCGAGEVISQLYDRLPGGVVYHGYEVSPQAFDLCRSRTRDRVHFHLKDPLGEHREQPFDLVLVIDVLEHVEDYIGFLRKLRPLGRNHIFHVPLDMNVQMVLRSKPIIDARKRIGHLHYFSRDTALRTLSDVGYRVIDHVYTPGSLNSWGRSFKTRAMGIPRRIAFSIHQDLAVRILGGFSLLILAE